MDVENVLQNYRSHSWHKYYSCTSHIHSLQLVHGPQSKRIESLSSHSICVCVHTAISIEPDFCVVYYYLAQFRAISVYLGIKPHRWATCLNYAFRCNLVPVICLLMVYSCYYSYRYVSIIKHFVRCSSTRWVN